MKVINARNHALVLLATAVFLAGCSGGEGDSSEQLNTTDAGSVPATISETSAPQTSSTSTSTTTTLPKDPQEELNLLAFFNQASDVSQIIETECGKFALLVLEDRITFHKWINNSWADNSDVLGPDGRLIPKFVKSVDFTGDYVLDLFVQYEDPDSSDPIGAVFLHDGCGWDWATFDDGEYRTDAFVGLSWSEQRESLGGSTENWDGYIVPFTVTYNGQTGMFESEYLPFQPPPPACVASFDLIKRKDYPEVLFSWFYKVYDRSDGPTFTWGDWLTNASKGTPVSLARCRREDWITEANRRRTDYTNHVDAKYYGETYVLLANENAPAILKELCTVKVYFGGTDEEFAYRRENSIACEGY